MIPLCLEGGMGGKQRWDGWETWEQCGTDADKTKKNKLWFKCRLDPDNVYIEYADDDTDDVQQEL
uniref:Uncharacterized protein n=1 Tax=Romanomermis culicivorax TaxID=13658 RepID=A0A915I384_ROMCU